jgi:hypothetical protein
MKGASMKDDLNKRISEIKIGNLCVKDICMSSTCEDNHIQDWSGNAFFWTQLLVEARISIEWYTVENIVAAYVVSDPEIYSHSTGSNIGQAVSEVWLQWRTGKKKI